MLDIPSDPAEAARVAFEGETKLLDVGEVDGKSFVGIASVGFDSDANRIANEAKLVQAATSCTPTRRSGRSRRGSRRASRSSSTARNHEVTGYSVGICNSKAYGGGMYAAPQAELDDGLLDVILSATTSKAFFLFRTLPRVFKGTHLDDPFFHLSQGRDDRGALRPPVHHVRGRRPARRPARHRAGAAAVASRSSPARLMFEAKVRLARAARVVSRRAGRGGTTAPGRLLLRLDEHAIGRLGGRLEDGAALLSATNGKTTTASMLADILERAGEKVVRNRAGSNMHWGVATALLDAGRRPGELGLMEVDEAWLPNVADRARPARADPLQPVPRPARPLRRARADRRPLGRARGASATAARASC